MIVGILGRSLLGLRRRTNSVVDGLAVLIEVHRLLYIVGGLSVRAMLWEERGKYES